MRRAVLLSLTVAGATAFFASGLGLGASGSGGVKLTAKLGAAYETPSPKRAARASGIFAATLSGRSLAWKLSFSGLTGKAAAAHIHLGKPGVAGPVAVPLCGPCASGVHRTTVVAAKVQAALLAGTAYVNVHTARNPAGEIRGQVVRAGAPGPVSAGTTTTTPTTTGVYGY